MSGPQPKRQPPTLSLRAAAKLVGLSPTALANRCEQGYGPTAITLPGVYRRTWRFRPGDIEAYLDRNTIGR
mgnify:CR=1 FL=1